MTGFKETTQEVPSSDSKLLNFIVFLVFVGGFLTVSAIYAGFVSDLITWGWGVGQSIIN